MIRRFSLGAALLVLSLMLTNCGKEEQAPETTSSAAPSIVGNWHLVGVTYNNQNTETASNENTSFIFTFGADNSMHYVKLFYGSQENGSYSLADKSLTINWSSSATTNSIESLTSDDLIILDPNPAISTVKSRHYKRISNEAKATLVTKYNVK